MHKNIYPKVSLPKWNYLTSARNFNSEYLFQATKNGFPFTKRKCFKKKKIILWLPNEPWQISRSLSRSLYLVFFKYIFKTWITYKVKSFVSWCHESWVQFLKWSIHCLLRKFCGKVTKAFKKYFHIKSSISSSISRKNIICFLSKIQGFLNILILKFDKSNKNSMTG